VTTYATEGDLSAWLTDNGLALPGGVSAVAYLRHAERIVRRATICDLYDTASDGTPTSTTVANALRDATCAQVGHWISLGVDPAAGPAGTTGVVQSSSMLSGSVQYATYASQAEERAAATVSLSEDALGILQAAGLGSATVTAW
jgi:hypothetical protein